MPALLPPSMQIGALPPGWSTLPPSAPSGVGSAAFLPKAPSIIQTVALLSTGAAQPASFAITIAGTQLGSTLVAGIIGLAQGGAQNIPTPTGFTQVSGAVQGTTIAGSMSVLGNVSAGITTVTWPTLTNWSSCVGVVWEVATGSATVNTAESGATFSTSATSQSSGAFTPQTNALIFAIFGCNSAQTIASSSTPGATFTGTSIQTSTNSQASVVNTSGQGVWMPTTKLGGVLFPVNLIATCGAATALGLAFVALNGSASAQYSATQGEVIVDQGAGYASGIAGETGWALGGTKPGGAGSGQ